ncbi:MAG: LutB/LldF family L-lactate oxidation iron-sulfur protein [Bryobacterales bacterium]|nr:LutB/LldF family L-lactate oxidation iron-sulfur protein [Bryobacterales bacterium]MDE0295532.1 LutB/LldF family L-lactate oxidation iron-sulfur protein [Bryobacterales bacterium]MDE0433691.1 LutB/LldF family L-lactate oxidation iron-sulfur protein [Bryobacterales bacterium]
MSTTFQQEIHVALGDLKLQKTITAATDRFSEKRLDVVAPNVLPEYQELRDQAHNIKQHTIDHLDYYLETVEARVQSRGGHVVWCADAEAAVNAVIAIARKHDAKLAVKSKSMVSEEIHLNDALEKNGIEPVETDLGEYIQQLARERPYHIVAPALHKTRGDVADLFVEKLGVERNEEPEELTQVARRVLRRKFLNADMGISGANFVVAESGAVVLVENEGNIRMTTSAPRIHVAVAGIEKLIPRAADLAVFLKLLGRSGSGQPITSYTSFLSGPRRDGEINGPDEFYLLLVDNGRTRVLADKEKRQTLYCIRCGACSNVCPVYRRIGGHSYPGTYSGPIGAILTPQFAGLGHEPALPFASSLCGACGEVCPVKIDIPRMLLALRRDVKKGEARENRWLPEKLAFRGWSWVMRRPWVFEWAGFFAQAFLSRQDGHSWIRTGPAMLAPWTATRDFPPLAPRSFRELWRARQSSSGWISTDAAGKQKKNA